MNSGVYESERSISLGPKVHNLPPNIFTHVWSHNVPPVFLCHSDMQVAETTSIETLLSASNF